MPFHLALLFPLLHLLPRSAAALLWLSLAAAAGAAEPGHPTAPSEIEVLSQSARWNHLEDQPVVAARIRAATDTILAAAERDRLAASAPISEADLRSRFESRSWAYGEYRLSHIYIAMQTVDRKTGRQVARSDAQALTRAQDLRRRLARGIGFTQLARESSDDASTASAGGALSSTFGMYLADEFVTAVRALADGEVSAPVRGTSGYHLIRLDANSPATFENARGMVEVELREEFKARAIADMLRQADGGKP